MNRLLLARQLANRAIMHPRYGIGVAEILSHLLGWPMPANIEGGIVYEALEDPDWYLKP